jgi:hypothetical protein
MLHHLPVHLTVQQISQLNHPGAHAGLNCPQWITEPRSDLCLRQSFEVSELQCPALLLRKLAQGRPDKGAFLGLYCFRGCVANVFAWYLRCLRGQLQTRTRGPQTIERPAARDCDHPGKRATARLIKVTGPAPNLEEDLLQTVFGLLTVIQYTKDDAE